MSCKEVNCFKISLSSEINTSSPVLRLTRYEGPESWSIVAYAIFFSFKNACMCDVSSSAFFASAKTCCRSWANGLIRLSLRTKITPSMIRVTEKISTAVPAVVIRALFSRRFLRVVFFFFGSGRDRNNTVRRFFDDFAVLFSIILYCIHLFMP